MKIYIVHIDGIPSDKHFNDLTDEEIEEMYAESTDWIDCYYSVEELAADWNTEEIFYPNMSYMRVIND